MYELFEKEHCSIDHESELTESEQIRLKIKLYKLLRGLENKDLSEKRKKAFDLILKKEREELIFYRKKYEELKNGKNN